jgi:branched-chain amino acid transport system substrate-binding protein
LVDATKKQLNARGVNEAMREAIAGEQDYTSVIRNMQTAGIDVFYVGSIGYTEAGLLVRQARLQGYDAQLVSGDGLATDEFWKITGDTGQGTLMISSPDPRKNEAAAPVVAEFQAQGYDPEGYTLYTYAAIQVWAQAAEKAGTVDLDAVLEQLLQTEFETVLGNIRFNEVGDVIPPDWVFNVWQNDGHYAQACPAGQVCCNKKCSICATQCPK